MSDMLREMAVNQGYVPKGCQMDGRPLWALLNGGDDPCRGCNYNKSECGGRKDKEEARTIKVTPPKCAEWVEITDEIKVMK